MFKLNDIIVNKEHKAKIFCIQGNIFFVCLTNTFPESCFCATEEELISEGWSKEGIL